MSSAERNRRLKALAPAYDVTNPPEGKKLVLGVVAARLNVTVSDMAEATGISRTSIGRVLTNEWPVRTDRAPIERALMELLEQRGCTDDELQTLFHAFGRGGVQANGAALERARITPADMHAAPKPEPSEEDAMLLPKQSLSPEARRHFKLMAGNPFDGEVTTEEAMFIGDDLRYCRETVWQCAHNGGFMALVGESGAGKTTLMQDLEVRLEQESRQVIVIRPGVLGMEGNDTKGKVIKSADILHAVITRLDPSAVVPQTLQARTVKAQKLLTGSAQIGNVHLLVVEEAHSMPDAALKHLKRLHEMRNGRRPLLSILLVAQPELKKRLADGLVDGSLREVSQRVEIVELLPLGNDLKGYLERRCSARHMALATLMDDAAVEAIRDRLTIKKGKDAISLAYPLLVNNLVTLALNEAAKLGAKVVTQKLIAAC